MMTFDFSKNAKPSLDADQVHPKILKQAQQSGVLNLSNRSLSIVPDSVWDLNTPLPPENASVAVDLDRDSGDYRWWETQPITRLLLTSNQITSIPGHGLVKLNTLNHLDLRDNQLSFLPDEIDQLTELRQLNLSVNKLQSLPAGLLRLGGLTQLDVSNNQLERLDGDLSKLTNLDCLNLSENKLTTFPDQLPPHVRRLNLSSNRLERLPSGILDQVPGLQALDISSNMISSLTLFSDPQSAISDHCQLATLHATFNKFTELPVLTGLKSLKELYLSDNRITDFKLDHLHGCSLVTVDVARNRISVLPNGISTVLPELVRLDVSANELTSLPTELGLMDSLQVLLVERNPLRSIRQNIISGGTNALKELLRQRHNPESVRVNKVAEHQSHTQQPIAPSANSEPHPAPGAPNKENFPSSASAPRSISTQPIKLTDNPIPTVNPTGVLDWSVQTKASSLEPVPMLPDDDSPDAWLDAATASKHVAGLNVRTLLLSHRKLTSVPTGVLAFATTLTSLSIDDNKLANLPDECESLTRLTTLDLSRNLFRALPAVLGRLSGLHVLRLDHNPLGPECSLDVLINGPVHNSLEHLSLRSCQLTQSPPPAQLTPDKMPMLSYLDLSDNAIGTVPPELGLCTQLKSLQLGGNTFRIPRPTLLTKGTQEILEYLRSRIPS